MISHIYYTSKSIGALVDQWYQFLEAGPPLLLLGNRVKGAAAIAAAAPVMPAATAMQIDGAECQIRQQL